MVHMTPRKSQKKKKENELNKFKLLTSDNIKFVLYFLALKLLLQKNVYKLI
jgi:hypothetical protein